MIRPQDKLSFLKRVETKYPLPIVPGFYWAQWRIVADGSTTDQDATPPIGTWEVVEVHENCLDRDDPEHLLVFVGGEATSQPLENFFWGPGPLVPPGGVQ